jgi:glycolate oxidase
MTIIDEITQIVGPQNVFTDYVERLCYSRDMSVHQGVADAVVFPRTTEQVSAIMKLAYRDKVPGPRVAPAQLGCSSCQWGFDLKYEQGPEISKKDFLPAPNRGYLHAANTLAKEGLMFPPTPAARSSLPLRDGFDECERAQSRKWHHQRSLNLKVFYRWNHY